MTWNDTDNPPEAGGNVRLIMFHKPRGVVVTRSDELGRKTVFDILPHWIEESGWTPVGRLDLDSRGLLLLTREGRLVELLTRPGGCDKTYEIMLRGHLKPEHLDQIENGVDSAVGVLFVKGIESIRHVGHKTRLRVILDEGKNRHLRRLFGALKDREKGTALKVLELKRVAIGDLQLDVEPGAWRFLTPAEERSLLSRSA